LIAVGFACGSAAHAISGLLLFGGIALYGPQYPAWRHAAMALVDAAMVWLAIRRTSWLVFGLLGFLIEQLLVNGWGPTPAFVLVALVWAGYETWIRPQGNSSLLFGAHEKPSKQRCD
jgi:hypothetical protein